MKKTQIGLIAAAIIAATPLAVPAISTFAATATPDYAAAANAAFPHVGPESLERSVVTVGQHGAPVYSTYKASTKTGRILPAGTSWKSRGLVKFTDNTYWYDLGGNQWVNYANLIHGVLSKTTGVVKIHYVHGYSIAVWNNFQNGQVTGKHLKDGTNWKFFKFVRMDDGHMWYNLGGNQWIDGSYAYQL